VLQLARVRLCPGLPYIHLHKTDCIKWFTVLLPNSPMVWDTFCLFSHSHCNGVVHLHCFSASYGGSDL